MKSSQPSRRSKFFSLGISLIFGVVLGAYLPSIFLNNLSTISSGWKVFLVIVGTFGITLIVDRFLLKKVFND